MLLLQVNRLQTSGHRRAGVTAGVEDVAAVVVLGLVEEGLKTRLRVAPGTRVQRLLLAPDNVLRVGVAVQVLLELCPGEGVQLLHTSDGGVADVVRLTVLHESSPDLTRAEDHTLNLVRLLDLRAVVGVRNDPAEVGVTSELLKRRAGKRVTQQRFREENNER